MLAGYCGDGEGVRTSLKQRIAARGRMNLGLRMNRGIYRFRRMASKHLSVYVQKHQVRRLIKFRDLRASPEGYGRIKVCRQLRLKLKLLCL